MKKILTILVSLVTAVSMTTTVFAFDDAVYFIGEEYASSNETVTVIVEVEGDPVLATEDALFYGTDYYFSHSGKMHANSIINTQSAVIAEMNDSMDMSISPEHTYTAIFNGFAVQIPENEVENVKKLPNVKNVYITYPYKLYLDTSVSQTNSLPTQTAVSGDTGYTGQKQVIAIIDNQFETGHEFFSVSPTNPKYTQNDIQELLPKTKVNSDHYNNVYISSKIPFAYNYADKTQGTALRKEYADGATIPNGHNHGTHVAGIAAGNNGELKGVAPDAQLLLMRTMMDNGVLSTAAVLEAIDDAVILGADVINLSLGIDYLSPQSNLVWDTPLKTARDLGVVVCAAAGNSKFGFSAIDKNGKTVSLAPSVKTPDVSAAGVPAGFSEATAIASVNNSSSSISSLPADDMSFFSSWGVDESLELKPEISAPGGDIYSSYISGYASMSGTSMASPHMSGVYALMYEYLDRNNSNLTGSARVTEVENMLMSTATIIRQSDDVPYSTRVQGAGLANTAAAVKTPAILVGNGNLAKSKISLGDNLDSTLAVSFNIKNLTNSPVTYDRISAEVTTNLSDGETISTSSKALTITNSNEFPDSIEVPVATEESPTKNVTLNISLKSDELTENASIFTNGFFIDGFVILATSDNSLPEISIPFTGFYGDWTDAPALDSTMYDEGGSQLYIENASSGTVLVSYNDDNLIICGKTPDEYNKRRIAISPNGDGLSDTIGIGLTQLRATKNHKITLSDTSGNVQRSSSLESGVVLPKYYALSILLDEADLADLDDGDYTFTYEATFNYDNAEPESITLPVVIDTQSPEFVDVDLSGNTLTVTAKDTHQIDHIQIVSDVSLTPLEKRYISTNIGAEITEEFTLPEDTALDTVKIVLTDCAENSTFVYMNNALDKIIPAISTNTIDLLNSGTIGFNLVNTGTSDITSDIILTCYNDSGLMIKSALLEDVLMAKGANTSAEFCELGDISSISYFKLFFWNNLLDLKPLDSMKNFY